MEPERHTIKSFSDFLAYIHQYPSNEGTYWIYRGHSNEEWELLPKAGRKDYFDLENHDVEYFQKWKSKAIAYENIPINDWEAMAIAQHYGLPTRMLDWTTNPLVALFFAVESYPMKDGCVYCYVPNVFISDSNDPFSRDDNVFGYMPRAINTRILVQKAVFTWHGKPNKPIEIYPINQKKDLPNLVIIRIPYQYKDEIRKELDNYGINDEYLFPGLEGLSKNIYRNWKHHAEKINSVLKRSSSKKP